LSDGTHSIVVRCFNPGKSRVIIEAFIFWAIVNMRFISSITKHILEMIEV